MSLLKKYQAIRAYSLHLCNPLEIEDYIPQLEEHTSPPKWHLAHTTWFFEEMVLKKLKQDYKEFNTQFNFLFNSYYQTIGERAKRSHRGVITRPLVSEVKDYRSYVDQRMVDLLSNEIDKKTTDLIILGLNHEQQHQELLITDLKYTFSHNPIHPIYKKGFDLVSDENENQQSWVSMEKGLYEIGHSGDGFCYDNELGRHKVYLDDFEISNHLVTNKEYLSFIEAGGYSNFNYWLDEAWYWLQENEIKAPLYWSKINNEWFYYTLSGLQKVNPEAIVTHISFYEAQAFATWKQMRLPTEFEWEVAADYFNWGKRWEWTYSAYLPYPNFKTAEGAVGEYNGKFMVNTMVLRGSSVATSEGHGRKTYRNFFHPKFRWQCNGIRLVK
jgi:ergothioneine biosynthesis protein EgtB